MSNEITRDSEAVPVKVSRPRGGLSVADAGRKGGLQTKARYGNEYYQRIGALGGNRVKELVRAGKEKLSEEDHDE